MKEFKIKIDAPKNKFKILVLGDMHIGDELCDLELIKETISKLKAHGKYVGFATGETSEKIIKC